MRPVYALVLAVSKERQSEERWSKHRLFGRFCSVLAEPHPYPFGRILSSTALLRVDKKKEGT
jgi:hypothetical protein